MNGWRSKRIIKEIITRVQNEDDNKYDAGKRERMSQPRKRKMNQDDVNLAEKMLRHGSGTHWTATFVNRNILDNNRGSGATVSKLVLLNKSIMLLYTGDRKSVLVQRINSQHGPEHDLHLQDNYLCNYVGILL